MYTGILRRQLDNKYGRDEKNRKKRRGKAKINKGSIIQKKRQKEKQVLGKIKKKNEEKINKINIKQLKKDNINNRRQGGWIVIGCGWQQKIFCLIEVTLYCILTQRISLL